MNTVAKRKIEQIVNYEIEQKTEAYKKRRKGELDALIERYENQPPKDVLAIQAKLNENKKAKERLEKELEAVGFELNYRDELTLRDKTHWDDKYRNSWKEYFVPDLTAHSKTTAETVGRVEALGRQYVLKIWAGEASAEVDLLQVFEQELAKLQT
jgi:hypothetical protein